jgi:hypothetical protein
VEAGSVPKFPIEPLNQDLLGWVAFNRLDGQADWRPMADRNSDLTAKWQRPQVFVVGESDA